MPDSNAHEDARARNEDCRREVRAWLANRPTIAAYVQQIARGLRHGHNRSDWSPDEVASALAFLTGAQPPQAVEIENGMGSTRFYQITSAGTLAHERDPRA